MKLKNDTLQKLYDTLVSAGVRMSPYADSPVYEAFRECDEKLSGLLVFEHIKSLKKDLDDAKNQLKYFTDSRDAWRGRAKHAEAEVEALKKDNKDLEKRLMETTETLEKVNSDRNFYHGLYTDLRKDYDKLSEENRKLNIRTNCIREEVEWYRKHYKEKCENIWELKARLNSIYGISGNLKRPDYEDCFNAMIDGFETMTCPYLSRTSITVQYDPDMLVFRRED